MKIAVLEKTNFSEEQKKQLDELGKVDYFKDLSQEEANKLAIQYDVVVVNWIDPSPFLLDMKPGSLVALLSTGYGWIKNIKLAHDKNILVSNIPNYSTEAVAEHLLGMLLGVSKNIFSTLNSIDNSKMGFELIDKTIGIIGLGKIGTRFAEIMHFFGANILTFNRTKKECAIAKDVSLEELLEKSDVVCVSCSVNDTSRNMINMSNVRRIKKGAIIIGTTWNIIEDTAMITALKEEIVKAISFDAAIEGNDSLVGEIDNYNDRVYFTPHIAYNTYESEMRQLSICIDNISSFVRGEAKNIVS